MKTLLSDHPVHLDSVSLANFMEHFSETEKLRYMGEEDDGEARLALLSPPATPSLYFKGVWPGRDGDGGHLCVNWNSSHWTRYRQDVSLHLFQCRGSGRSRGRPCQRRGDDSRQPPSTRSVRPGREPGASRHASISRLLAAPLFLLRPVLRQRLTARHRFSPEQVLELIEAQTKKVDQRLDALLLVGGFSGSEYLFRKVKVRSGERSATDFPERSLANLCYFRLSLDPESESSRGRTIAIRQQSGVPLSTDWLAGRWYRVWSRHNHTCSR